MQRSFLRISNRDTVTWPSSKSSTSGHCTHQLTRKSSRSGLCNAASDRGELKLGHRVAVIGRKG